MFRNYLLIAWRNFIRHRTFSLINIVGFSVAMASCFLIVFHIRSELSYEKGFPSYRNIFRVHPSEWAKSAPPLARAMADYFPEIKSTARFYEFGNRVLRYNDFQTEVKKGFMADSSVIEMFDLQFVQGSAEKSLRVPFTIVLTESLAKKFFHDEDPVGKMIKINDRTDYAVTGVIKDFPENTHFKIDFLVSFTTFYKAIPDSWTSQRGWMAPYTYVSIEPNDLAKVMEKLGDFRVKFYEGWDTPENIKANNLLEFQPLKDIHLYSHLEQEMSENSNAGYLYIFGAVAIFIIFIASVNFINLNISLAFRRLKETGMRKVMGAFRFQLIRQYLTETLLISCVSFLLALTLFFAVLPNYNELAGRAVQIKDVFSFDNLSIITILILTVSLLSGLYPALFMSRFKPIDSLKSQKSPRSTTSYVRKALVIFQFSVSVFMIASTLVIYRQMKFFQTENLGFDKNQIVTVNLYGDLAKKFVANQEVIKSELRKNSSILSIGSSSVLPGDMISVEGIRPANVDRSLEFPSFRVMRVDYDLIPTLRLSLLAGRNFSPEFNDSVSFIINEAAVKALKLTSPIGSLIENQTRGITGYVIGVVRDFHLTSLHNAIEPLAIEYNPAWTDNLFIKISADNPQPVLRHIEATLKNISPSNLFSYNFFDQKWDSQYREENKMSSLFNAFSIFMIVISCIGLFGLSAIAIETRRKEIGIRKVVGASIQTILGILSREFMVMVVVGALIALPLAWYAMNQWLQKFAFKISITADVFVITIVITILVAFGSVLFNTLKAARTNPVESLRNE